MGQSGKEESTATKFEDYCQVSFVTKAFKAITLYVINQAQQAFDESKAPKKDKTNKIFGIDLVKMTQVHIKYITYINFLEYLDKIEEKAFYKHLYSAACIMGLQWIIEYAQFGYGSGYLK
jgi:hypothetical protein